MDRTYDKCDSCGNLFHWKIVLTNQKKVRQKRIICPHCDKMVDVIFTSGKIETSF